MNIYYIFMMTQQQRHAARDKTGEDDKGILIHDKKYSQEKHIA